MKKFVHMGMPKTLSSALQEGFFYQHESIHFLGVGVGSLIDYVNDSLNVTFETLIPYASEAHYQRNKKDAIQSVQKEINFAVKNGKSWVGVSSEWLGFNFTPEMADAELKIKRLSEVMGTDAHVILVSRNNTAFLRSLYGELVKVGLSLSFQQYCSYLWAFQDRSSLNDFLYDIHYERLLRYFKKENIHFVILENFRDAEGNLKKKKGKVALIEYLCNTLDLIYPSNFELPKVNPSLDEHELYQKLELNKKYRHDFGNLIFEPSNVHRSRKYLETVGAASDMDFFADVKVKRFLLAQAKELAQNSKSKVSYELSDLLERNLESLFYESNKNFEKMTGIEMPEAYFSGF